MSALTVNVARVLRGVARRSPRRFVKSVHRHQSLGWTPLDPPADGPAGALQRDGFLVLSELLTKTEVATFRSESGPLLDAALAGTEVPHRVLTDNRNTALVDQADVFCPTLAAVLADAGLTDIVSNAAGLSLKPSLFRAEIKTAKNDEYPFRNPEVDMWHVDHWDVRTKAMVYLTDVNTENAPLRYLPGSHHDLAFDQKWLAVHWLREFFMTTPKVPQLLVWAWERYERRRGSEAHHCTGPAGTVVLFDTRGLHSGTALSEGQRHIFNVHYSPNR